MTEKAGGIYTLVIEVPEACSTTVGALGAIEFDAGFYAYVGSALGQGGFSRIERHRELASDDRDVRHWHIDYLLGRPAVNLVGVDRSANVEDECGLARGIGGPAIDDFGCSDCDCDSHLFYREDRDEMNADVRSAHRAVDEALRGDRV